MRTGHPVASGDAVSGPRRRAFPLELRRALGERAAFGLFLMAPVLYGVLYPQPYLGQLFAPSPSPSSTTIDRAEPRGSIQALNASEALSVAVRTNTLAERRRHWIAAQVFGIVDIPAGTEREVLARPSWRGMPAYIDSAYFLSIAAWYRASLRRSGR